MLRPEAFNTLNALNLNLLDEIWLDEQSGMPTVNKCEHVPVRMVPFTKAARLSDQRGAVHFYQEDYAFSHFWSAPGVYLQRLWKFDSVIAPDFSTYLDMPRPMVEWQIYRRRMLTQWMQRSGLQVIYNVQTLPSCYDAAQLSGVESGGVVAMRTPLGYKHNKEGRMLFLRTIQSVNETLHPCAFLLYGYDDDRRNLPSNINFKIYENDTIRVRRVNARRKREVLDNGTETKRW